MKKYIFGLSFLLGSLILSSPCAFGSDIEKKGTSSIYLQERMVRIQLPAEGVANIVKMIRQGTVISAISANRVFSFEKGKWRVEQFPGVWQTGCLDPDGALWLGGIGQIARFNAKKEMQLPAEASGDTIHTLLWESSKILLAGTNKGAWQWNGTWQKIPELKSLAIHQMIQSGDGDLWAATEGGLFHKMDGSWVNLSYAILSPGLGINYYSLAEGAAPGDLYFGSFPALGLISKKGDHRLYSADNGLPIGPVTTICQSGAEIWLGTPDGAIRKAGDAWHYYGGKRWLDDNRVNDILPIDSQRVWVATAGGINQLEKMPMTLAQKAAYFEKRLNERHLHHNFASELRFNNLSDTTNYSHSTNDNDGLWSSIYLAAESFRYAVTGEQEAYDNAVRTYLAMEKLGTVNPIPGFVARSYVSAEESTGDGGEWHLSADGKWKWKGDTSSDEIVGHMFAYPIFYDLVAKGEMKERVRGMVDRLMTHIVDHNFQLDDLDGLATRWAVWTPDSLNHSKRWLYEKGINSLQILAFLKSAAHVTQNPKYEKAYNFLAREHHYLENMLVQKMYGPYEINHSDDELSFLPYYTLMRYGKESKDHEFFVKSLTRSWNAEKADGIPIWNYISSIGLEKDCGLGDALLEMQQIPLDLRSWRMVNSHRWDIRKSAINDRFFKPQATKSISPAERAISKWNSNPYQLDGGGDGLGEDDGAFFLLPYWMARFHRLIEK